MRRLPVFLVIAAACGTMLSLGTLTALFNASHDGGRGAPEARALQGLAPSPAMAQEVMEFKPVPAESVADVGRSRSRRGREPVPAAPSEPSAPAVPGMPPAPAPPAPDVRVGIEVDRSGDVVRFGSDIHIREGQTIAGDVVAMGGDVMVDGHVEGDVVAMGGDVILNSTGKVDGEVVTLGGQLREESGSYVGGQRVTAGGIPKGWFGWPFLGFMGVVGTGLKAAWAIAKMVVVLLIAWGFTQLAPSRTSAAYDAFKREPLMCFGVGLLAWALVIPSIVALALVVAILCITIIGIPLAIAVLLGYVLALILLTVWGYVVGSAVLGERLSRQLGRPAASLTLMAVWGIVALTAVRVLGHLFGGLPMGGFAGGMLAFLVAVTSCVLVTMGAGALLRTQLRRDAMGQWWAGRRATAAQGAGTATPSAAPAGAPGPSAAAESTMPSSEPPPITPPTGL